MEALRQLLTSSPDEMVLMGATNRAALVERAIQIMESGPERSGLTPEEFDRIKAVWLQNKRRSPL